MPFNAALATLFAEKDPGVHPQDREEDELYGRHSYLLYSISVLYFTTETVTNKLIFCRISLLIKAYNSLEMGN